MAYALFPLTEDQGGGTERSIHAHVCMDVSVHARRHVCPNVFVHVHGGGMCMHVGVLTQMSKGSLSKDMCESAHRYVRQLLIAQLAHTLTCEQP